MALMLHQLWWFSTLWIYMIVFPFYVNDGRVHCERLFSIVLYWYGLWHKLCNVRCIIHFDFCYAYNHFDCLILVYTMILSLLRQAFQGLAPNRSFVYLKCWNLENIYVLKTPEYFGVEQKLSIFVSLWTMVLFTWHLINLRRFATDVWQRLKRHIKSFVQFCSYYGDCIHHYSDGAATLNWHVSYERHW
jgi:hypothetical protein